MYNLFGKKKYFSYICNVEKKKNMRAFKGFVINNEGQLICRGMVYEVGKTYKYDGDIKLCK